MAEYIANALQTVEENQNILFTDTTVCGNGSIIHNDGSGLVMIRGITNQWRARFKVTFGGNIAIPTGGTVGEISVGISVNGETIPVTAMRVTPAAVGEFFNVNRSIYLNIPAGCCMQVGIKNTSTQTIDVQNASLIIERVA